MILPASCLTSCVSSVTDATFCVAPAEGNKPKYIITDENSEVLAFPDMFPYVTGSFNTEQHTLRKLDLRCYFNPRLLNVDGRFPANVEYLLAAQYTTELKQVQGNIGITLRTKKGKTMNGQKLTAGMLQTPYCDKRFDVQRTSLQVSTDCERNTSILAEDV